MMVDSGVVVEHNHHHHPVLCTSDYGSFAGHVTAVHDPTMDGSEHFKMHPSPPAVYQECGLGAGMPYVVLNHEPLSLARDEWR